MRTIRIILLFLGILVGVGTFAAPQLMESIRGAILEATSPETITEIGQSISLKDFTDKVSTAVAPSKKDSDFVPPEIIANVSPATKRAKGKLDIAGIVALTNQERLARGLTPLAANPQLELSADRKVVDMLEQQYFEHLGPDGRNVQDHIKEAGYPFILVGENLAQGTFSSNADIVEAWMNSPEHRENILREGYKEIGIGIRWANLEGHDVWVGVQHFGIPLSECPGIDATLQANIDQTQKALRAFETELDRIQAEIEATPEIQKSLPAYVNLVQQYNSGVEEYNQELARNKSDVASYNQQVRAFNACLDAHQN